jgi:hypothetical protein
MKSLNIKKTGASLLILAIVAGCSSNTPVSSVKAPPTKVDAVKVSPVQTINLGAKNGGTVKFRLNLGEKPSFSIKNKYPVNTSGLPLISFSLFVNLYRTPIGTTPPPPKQRFDAPDPANINSNTSAGTVYRYWNHYATLTATNDLTFSGLQAGFDYYITARLYSPFATIYEQSMTGDTDGFGYDGSADHDEPREFLDATKIYNIRTPWVAGVDDPSLEMTSANGFSPAFPGYKKAKLDYLALNPTDEIYYAHGYIAGAYSCAIVDTPPQAPDYDSFTIAPYTLSAANCPTQIEYGFTGAVGNMSNVPLHMLWRNVVGVGNVGVGATGNMGMASNDNALGGGTAPGYTGYNGAGCTTPGTCEEFINIQNNGLTKIVNDDSPATPGAPDGFWDVKINLMHSLAAELQNPGNLVIYPGQPDQVPNVAAGLQ